MLTQRLAPLKDFRAGRNTEHIFLGISLFTGAFIIIGEGMFCVLSGYFVSVLINWLYVHSIGINKKGREYEIYNYSFDVTWKLSRYV